MITGVSYDKLLNAILRLIDPDTLGHQYPPTRAAAVVAWTDAYNDYALDAKDVSSDVVQSVNRNGFENELFSNFYYSWTARVTARSFADAFVAYWSQATFAIGTLIPGTGVEGSINEGPGTRIFSVELSSTVQTVTGDNLEDALYSEFVRLDWDAPDKAARITQCFHDATINDVIVFIDGLDTTPPPLGPLTVTNLYHIF